VFQSTIAATTRFKPLARCCWFSNVRSRSSPSWLKNTALAGAFRASPLFNPMWMRRRNSTSRMGDRDAPQRWQALPAPSKHPQLVLNTNSHSGAPERSKDRGMGVLLVRMPELSVRFFPFRERDPIFSVKCAALRESKIKVRVLLCQSRIESGRERDCS
jgi:hypothetical protein